MIKSQIQSTILVYWEQICEAGKHRARRPRLTFTELGTGPTSANFADHEIRVKMPFSFDSTSLYHDLVRLYLYYTEKTTGYTHEWKKIMESLEVKVASGFEDNGEQREGVCQVCKSPISVSSVDYSSFLKGELVGRCGSCKTRVTPWCFT